MLRRTLMLLLVGSIEACTVLKSPVETGTLFTSEELLIRGVLLAPVAQDIGVQASDPAELSLSDFAAYDRIFANVLEQSWEKKNISVVSTASNIQKIGADQLEVWRNEIAHSQSLPSKDIDASLDKAFVGKNFLIVNARLLTNQVSCGVRESVPSSYTKALPPSRYCQRIAKMQFEIVDRKLREKVWSGLIYASEENSDKVPGRNTPPPTAPSVEGLLRQAFKNFAQLIAGSLSDRR